MPTKNKASTGKPGHCMGDGIKIHPEAEELQADMFMSGWPGLIDCNAQVAINWLASDIYWNAKVPHPIKV